MSRIPAPGAIVGTTTVSAVLALCLLGSVGAQAPAAAAESTTGTSTIGASLIADENTATVVGLTTTTATLSDATTNPAVSTAVSTAGVVTTATNDSAGTAASIVSMQTLGLAGGVASEQIPAAAMLSSAAATASAHVVAVPASLAKKVAAKPVAAAITGTPLQVAHTIATQAGLSQQQWVCLDSLWQQESKFQTNARNRRSGAFGIPQALPASRMASAGADWRTNPATQVKWGLSYIRVRYATACNAWAHWKRDRWY